jgi:hypothetical protein
MYRKGAYMAVANEAAEAAAVADGWTDYASDRAAMGLGDPPAQKREAEPDVVVAVVTTTAPVVTMTAEPKRKPGRPRTKA